MGDGFNIGFQAGSALANGVAQWKQIQLDRQQRREFDGAMALASQRRGMIKSAGAVEEATMLEQLRAQVQRSPTAERAQRPTGGVREDGQPETEDIIRTPEGDIPVAQILQLKARKQQADTSSELAEVNLIMELQSRYPANPYVKQWVASTYAGIQQKQQIRSKQVEAQRLQLDTLSAGLEREKFEEEARQSRERLGLQRQQYEEGPGREREAKTFETDERIRGDAARIEAQKGADLEVEGVRAQNKPERAPTEFVKKLQQMAPRAQQALEKLEELDVDRAGIGLGAQSLLPNAARSSKRQEIDQAAGQLVNSLLRAESGATITESEIEKGKKQYIPQLGDSEEVIAQKRQARRTAVQELYRAAELEAPQGAQPRSREDVRAAFKAGKLSRDQAKAMLRSLPQ